jgi:hypothetical protein
MGARNHPTVTLSVFGRILPTVETAAVTDSPDKPRAGRPSRGLSEKIVVKIPPALRDALDARVAALNAEAERKGGIEVFDRSTVVRACLAKCLAAELKASAKG